MELGRGDTDRAGLTARMRGGIADAVRARGQLRATLGPSALVSFLVAAAFVPFLAPLLGHGLSGAAEGELGAALNQLGAMGGGYLTDVLTKAADRMRRDSLAKDGATAGAQTAGAQTAGDRAASDPSVLIRDDLAAIIQEALDAPGEATAGLRTGISDALRELDAVKVALAADRDNVLAPGFAELGGQMTEFRWVLGDVRARLSELRQMLARQGTHQRVQMRSARASLDTITVLLQRVAAAQEHDADAAREDGSAATRAVPACPYPGMRPFGSRDARRFFGREDLTAHLAGRLAEQAGAGAPLVVLGPSGAGKSSLLRAGLIPALRGGLMPVPGSARWPRVLLDRPGAHPLAALAGMMTRHPEPLPALGGDPADLAAALAAATLTARARTGGDRDGGGPHGGTAGVRPVTVRPVVVVDQFEDVFTQCADEAERLQFVRVLLALARPRPGTGDGSTLALVVLGLRADFYQDCANIADLAELLPDNQVVVGPLAEPDLRRAISQPAAAVGVAVEPGLPELLLADLGGRPGRASYEPGALPLLGYALQATWNRQAGRTLTVAAYREAGGIHGAVANEAERIYADFPPAAQAMTRRVMLRLVSVGPDLQQTRRRVARTDLLAGLDAPAAETAVTRFTQARLVTADADGVEITHEAFLGAWPRLREWIDEDRAGLRLHRQIGGDARTWAGEGSDPGGLYRGTRLGSARQWRSAGGNEAELTELEREFLDASAAAEQAEKAAQEREQQRDRRQNRRLRGLAAGLGVVLVVALAAAGVAGIQRQHAQTQRDTARSEADAALSDSSLATNLRSADLYALAAWQASHTTDARSSLLSREADPYLGSFTVPRTADDATALAVSPDSRLLAVGEQPSAADQQQGTVQLWDLAARKERATFAGLGGHVQTVAFSPDGQTLAAVVLSVKGNVRFWDVATHRALPDPVTQTGPVSALAYSPDGKTLAVAEVVARAGVSVTDPPAEVDLWDLASHRLVRRLTGITGEFGSLAFSPDGHLLAGGGQNSTRIWDVGTGTQRAVLHGQGGPITSVVFSRDGRSLATVSFDGSDWVWQVATATPYLKVTNGQGGVTLPGSQPAAFSPGDQYLSVGNTGSDINRYNLSTAAAVGAAMDVQQQVSELISSPDGRTLVAAGPDGSLFELDMGQRTFYVPGADLPTALTVSPDGRTAATGSADGTVELWPADDPATARILARSTAGIADAAFSPGGDLLAAIGNDCTVRVWDAATGRRLTSLAAAGAGTDLVLGGSLSFGPDGKTLATYCSGAISDPSFYTAILWDTATFRPIASVREAMLPDVAPALAYAPDGHALALAGGSGRVLLWDTRTHRVTARISTGQEPVQAIAFSPDGKLLATAGQDSKTVKLWNVANGAAAGAATGPQTSPVEHLAFSPDGSILATASQDSIVRLWTVRSRRLLASLSVPAQDVIAAGTPAAANGVAFGPGGRTLVSTYNNGTAQVWDLSPAHAIRQICAALRGPDFASQWRAVSSGPAPCPTG
jgi:WD40 repeat protein